MNRGRAVWAQLQIDTITLSDVNLSHNCLTNLYAKVHGYLMHKMETLGGIVREDILYGARFELGLVWSKPQDTQATPIDPTKVNLINGPTMGWSCRGPFKLFFCKLVTCRAFMHTLGKIITPFGWL